MKDVRKEVADLTRYCDILLNSATMQTPLTDRERELLTGYLLRVWQKLNLSLPGEVEPTSEAAELPSQAQQRTAFKDSA